MMESQFPPRQMVMSPILPQQGLAMLYSRRGVGKTYLALGIAHAVARGGAFLRWSAARPRKVLFVDGELPAPVSHGPREWDSGTVRVEWELRPEVTY